MTQAHLKNQKGNMNSRDFSLSRSPNPTNEAFPKRRHMIEPSLFILLLEGKHVLGPTHQRSSMHPVVQELSLAASVCSVMIFRSRTTFAWDSTREHHLCTACEADTRADNLCFSTSSNTLTVTTVCTFRYTGRNKLYPLYIKAYYFGHSLSRGPAYP